jgi:hypothetical protein
LVNSPGTGSGGADESMLQTALGMGIFGFGHQVSAGFRVADDFTIPDGGSWALDQIVFYAYQTGAPTSSTITAVNLQIWDGEPGNGGSIIWGDTTTNVMVDTIWSGIYRVLDTTSGDTNRAIMANTVDLGGLSLPPGTYWLDWQADGSLASGPWVPPVTINGQTTTGNALQSNAGAWGPLVDVGPQGLPFQIIGSSGCEPIDLPWVSTNPISGTTNAGDSTDIDVVFDSTGLATGVYTGTLCVKSNASNISQVAVPITLTVASPTYAIDIAPDTAVSGLPGTTVTHTMWITNNSNVAGVVSLAIDPAMNWISAVSDNNFVLNPGEVTMIYAWADIPADAAGGDMDMVTVTASIGDASDSATATTTAENVYGVELTADAAMTDTAGTTVTYALYITNTGNTTDTYDIVASGNNWTTTPDSPVTLAAGESMMVMVTVDIPADANDGDMDVATVTATSQSDGTVSSSVTLTTTAQGFFLYLPFIVKN